MLESLSCGIRGPPFGNTAEEKASGRGENRSAGCTAQGQEDAWQRRERLWKGYGKGKGSKDAEPGVGPPMSLDVKDGNGEQDKGDGNGKKCGCDMLQTVFNILRFRQIIEAAGPPAIVPRKFGEWRIYIVFHRVI